MAYLGGGGDLAVRLTPKLVERDVRRRRREPKARKNRAHFARGFPVIPGEFHLAVADLGNARQCPIEVASEIAPHGVELNTDAVETPVGHCVSSTRARRAEERGTARREEG